MSIRLRKFIGLMILLFWLFVYVLLAVGLAVRVLPGAHWAVELLFYVVAGIAWVFPARYLIYWMSKLERA
jgi:hypothetical protein